MATAAIPSKTSSQDAVREMTLSMGADLEFARQTQFDLLSAAEARLRDRLGNDLSETDVCEIIGVMHDIYGSLLVTAGSRSAVTYASARENIGGEKSIERLEKIAQVVLGLPAIAQEEMLNLWPALAAPMMTAIARNAREAGRGEAFYVDRMVTIVRQAESLGKQISAAGGRISYVSAFGDLIPAAYYAYNVALNNSMSAAAVAALIMGAEGVPVATIQGFCRTVAPSSAAMAFLGLVGSGAEYEDDYMVSLFSIVDHSMRRQTAKSALDISEDGSKNEAILAKLIADFSAR